MYNLFQTQGWVQLAAVLGVVVGLGAILVPYVLWGGDDLFTVIIIGLGGAYLATRSALWAIRNHTVERRKGPRRTGNRRRE